MNRRWKRIAIVVGALFLAGGIFVAAGQLSDTENAEIAVSGNPGLEGLIPARRAEILRQDRVGVDLAPGYDAQLAINGTVIPTSQLERGSDLSQVFYIPRPGKVIERLSESTNCATAQIWRVAEGPETAGPPIKWCFDAL